NVKVNLEDCGYSTDKHQLQYQLKELFNLLRFPLDNVTSGITKLRAGYFFGEARAVKELQKNHLPMFFIHGENDTFVPV
ncbi:alpha/beta hydrolase, partial [Enterococcus faecalis]